jgi:hypothetical protein
MPTPMHWNTHKHTKHSQTNINTNIHSCISGKKSAHRRTHEHASGFLWSSACFSFSTYFWFYLHLVLHNLHVL